MTTLTLPDGTVLTWNGSMDEKVRILGLLGISYSPTPEELLEVEAENRLREDYIATINQLETIENAVNPTNAQVVAAVKFLAKTIRFILRFLAKQYQ